MSGSHDMILVLNLSGQSMIYLLVKFNRLVVILPTAARLLKDFIFGMNILLSSDKQL